MSAQLTPGAIGTLFNGSEVKNPVLQLLNLKKISSPNGPNRFRLMMSDGQQSSTSFLLVTQLNNLAEESILEPNCVCVLKKTLTNTLTDGRCVVVVMGLEILQSAEETGGKIGSPTPFGTDDKSPENSGSSTFVSSSAAAPQPSDERNSTYSPPRGSGRGFVGTSPMKASPMMASPMMASPMKASPMMASTMMASPMKASSMKASPMMASPMKASPMMASPMKASPMMASPMKASPMMASPMKASPMKASPMMASPMKASTMMASPMKASPMMASPMKTSPMKFSPMKASPMTPSPMKFSPTKATTSSPGSSTKVWPIETLNPYQSKWTIRARVTHKASIRTWNNSRGEGKLFSFEMVDESGEIRVTAFNKEVDKFFPLVEQGKVYYISKAVLKPANKQYTTVKNEYEMTLQANSSIVLCDDSQGVPTLHCDFVPIAELENRDNDAIVDVIGVCKSVEDVSRITTKASREVSKRALSLIDTTGKVVTVTLWGEEAEKFDGSEEPVVVIKGARVSDFGGRSLSASFGSTVMVNPDIPEAFRLRTWYDEDGFALNSQSLTSSWSASSGMKINWKTLSDMKNESMGHGEKADYFSCVATLLFTRKDTCLYRSCPSADCKKKVTDQQNGLYRCEKCNREFPNFKYRFLLFANLADFGDNQWVTCFQETAEVLLGHTAEALGELKDTDETAFDEVFQKAHFTTHIFKNRVKLETYNDESRVKVTVIEVQPLDHREYSRRLLRDIRTLSSSDRVSQAAAW